MIAAAKIASALHGDLVSSLGRGTARPRWLAPVIGGLRRATHAVRQLGPYAAIELILPGGSVLALLLWLYRRNRRVRQERPADLQTGLPVWPKTCRW